jgi:hypothetical protein
MGVIEMPNWCENYLIITGSEEALNKIEKTKFDFQNIIPMPEEMRNDKDNIGGTISTKEFNIEKYNIDGYDWESSRLTDDQKATAKRWVKEYGYAGWYYWHCAEWGTKWNSTDPKFNRDNSRVLRVNFSTAWCPPVPILLEVSKKYDCKIDMEYDVEMQDSGRLKIENGQLVEHEDLANEHSADTMYLGAPETKDFDEPEKV